MNLFIMPKYVVYFNSDDEHLFLRKVSGRSVCLKGWPKEFIISVLPQLRNGISEPEIKNSCKNEKSEEAIDLLYKLVNEGILEIVNDSETPQNYDSPLFLDLASRVSLRSIDRVRSRLKSSKVLVIPNSKLTEKLALSLKSYEMNVEIQEYQTKEEDSEPVRTIDWLKDIALVVSSTDNMNLPLLENVHKRAFQNGVPWIGSYIDGSQAIVGPFVIPSRTACFECAQTRLSSNSEDIEEDIAYRKMLHNTEGVRMYSMPLLHLMEAVLCENIINYLATGVAPELNNRIMQIRTEPYLQITVNEAIKVPRCSVCGQ